MEVRHEFWVSDPPEDVVRKIRASLRRIGDETGLVPGTRIEGRVAFGVQAATMRIMWRGEMADESKDAALSAVTARAPVRLPGTLIIIESVSEHSEAAARSAAERFEDAYLHYSDAAYKPDRLGVMPLTIIGACVAVFLLGLLLWRIPAVRHAFTNAHPHIVPSAPLLPTPTPDPDTGAAADGK